MIPIEVDNPVDADDSDVSCTLTVREADCLVYIVDSPAGIGVRSRPTTDEKAKTELAFNHKELVSVDFIETARYTTSNDSIFPITSSHVKAKQSNNQNGVTTIMSAPNGPFLRLSDDSGWLFESKAGRQILKPVIVNDGLWVLIVHNPPEGHILRSHPVDRDDCKVRKCDHLNEWQVTDSQCNNEFVAYWPTQRLYCDKRVVHPVSGVQFFRVQGTRGWVFDRKPGFQIPYLIDENLCRKGLFAFQNLKATPLEVRAWPTVDDNARTGCLVTSQDIVIADMILEVSHTTTNTVMNGPFIHLIDGGWLFQNKGNSRVILGRVTIEQGYWVFKVVTETGVHLSSQPMLKAGIAVTPATPMFGYNALVKCDRKITSKSGISYYRVSDTKGWIPDMVGGMTMIEMLRSSSFPPITERNDTTITSNGGWDPQFVRGIAAVAADGSLEEVDFDEVNRMIRFTARDDSVISVFFSSRTVGISTNDSLNSRTQVFRRDCTAPQLLDIMNDPMSYVEKRFDRKNKKLPVINTSIGSGFVIEEEEEEIRNELISLHLQSRFLKSKQLALLRSLKDFEAKSMEEAQMLKNETDALCAGMKEKDITTSLQLPAVQTTHITRTVSVKKGNFTLKTRLIHETPKEDYSCLLCRRVFHNAQYLNHHRRDVHGLECNRCYRIFATVQLLKHHRESEGHW